MPKLTPKIPLLLDKTQPGFELINNYRDLIKQNMKMILLTNPGERVMLPEFGVGISGLLFENILDANVKATYEGRIRSQIKEYLPYVELIEANFIEDTVEQDMNKVSMRLVYYVPSLGIEDTLYT